MSIQKRLRFKVEGWLSPEEFRELLEFSDYIGRYAGSSIFEVNLSKMKKSGYTLRDIYVKLSSLKGVDEGDLEAIKIAYLEESKVEIWLGSDGFLRVSSRAYLKDVFLEMGVGLHYVSEEKAYKAPAHLYYSIVSFLKSKGFNVVDNIKLLDLKLPRSIIFNGSLRSYQEEALNTWIDNNYRGVIALPTGAGKTIVAISGIAKLNTPTLIVVYTKDHIKQWIDAFKKFSDAVSLVGAYYSDEKKLAPITITTYQTAYRKLEVFALRYPLIVFDEAHHLPAEKFKHIAFNIPAPYRLALSATPEREDGRHVEIFPLIGGVIYHKTASELADQGFLAPFIIRRVSVNMTIEEMKKYEELKRRFQILARNRKFSELVEEAKRGDKSAIEALKIHADIRDLIQYSEAKLKAVVDLIKKELEKGSKIIVFTQFREQAEEIARRANALLLHGELSVRERDETLRRFRTAKTGVLVVTTVGDEGLDIPDVNIGIFVSGTGSRRQFIQRLGRLLRPAPGKKAVLYEVVVRGTSEEYQSKRRKELI
ncbi:MAG: DEAD/DEAH box helicase [Acidilobaceae archaeon]